MSPLKGALAVAREDQAARFRVSTSTSPIKFKIGEKRQREPQDDIDMQTSEGEQDDPDETITPGNSKRMIRPSGISGRSVRRKFGIESY